MVSFLIKRPPLPHELVELRVLARFQFRGVGEEFIPEDVLVAISPSTGKIRYLERNGAIYLSIRASDYRLLLHKASGYVLNKLLPHPYLRIYVNPKYAPYIMEGGNVFSKHVVYADPAIRPGDEVLAVNSKTGELLGVGKAVKPGWVVTYYKRGEALRIREGVLED